MVNTKRFGSVKRFGSRYGRTSRNKVAHHEAFTKKTHLCPYCNRKGVKKVSVGVWGCKKCGAKFTGKAYDFDRKKIAAESQQ